MRKTVNKHEHVFNNRKMLACTKKEAKEFMRFKVVLDFFTLLIWAQPNKLKLEFSINHKCSQFKMKSAIYTITAVIQWTSLLNVFIPQKKYLVCKTLGTLLAGQQYFMPYIPTLFVNSQAGSCVCYATCMHIYYLG